MWSTKHMQTTALAACSVSLREICSGGDDVEFVGCRFRTEVYLVLPLVELFMNYLCTVFHCKNNLLKAFHCFFHLLSFFFNSRHHQGCWKQRSYPLFKRVNLNYIGVEFNENKREKTWSNRSWEKSWKSVIMLRTGQGRRPVFKVLHGKFNKSLHPSFRWL